VAFEGDYVEEGLRRMFLNFGELSALIGDRWYGPELPAGTAYPAVTMKCISSIPEISHQGEAGLEAARYSCIIHGDCAQRCMQVAAKIRRVIKERPRGQLPNGIRYSLLQRLNDFPDVRSTSRDNWRHVLDFRLWYRPDNW